MREYGLTKLLNLYGLRRNLK